MTVHNPRLHAFRPDLADIRLKGNVRAERYVSGEPARVSAAVADVRRNPDRNAGLDTQVLRGDQVTVFERRNGWAWVQAARDGYVGYVEEPAFDSASEIATHVVSVPRSFVYPGADLRFPVADRLSMGSLVTVVGTTETRGTQYAMLSSGEAMISVHLRPVAEQATDFVTIAERFINTPYLWGGTSGFGIDCSGLVQLAMRMTDRDVLRDTDMQEACIGTVLDPGEHHANVRRGDLVFWKGHVAIMTNSENMVHANGHTMLVSNERLDDAVKRIGYLYGQPTSFRRP